MRGSLVNFFSASGGLRNTRKFTAPRAGAPITATKSTIHTASTAELESLDAPLGINYNMSDKDSEHDFDESMDPASRLGSHFVRRYHSSKELRPSVVNSVISKGGGGGSPGAMRVNPKMIKTPSKVLPPNPATTILSTSANSVSSGRHYASVLHTIQRKDPSFQAFDYPLLFPGQAITEARMERLLLAIRVRRSKFRKFEKTPQLTIFSNIHK